MLKSIKYGLHFFLMLMSFYTFSSSAPFQQLPQEINWEILEHLINSTPFKDINPLFNTLSRLSKQNAALISNNTEKLINSLSKRTGNNKARAAKIIGTKAALDLAKTKFKEDLIKAKEDETYLKNLIHFFDRQPFATPNPRGKIDIFSAQYSNDQEYNDAATAEIIRLIKDGVDVTYLDENGSSALLLMNIRLRYASPQARKNGLKIIELLKDAGLEK